MRAVVLVSLSIEFQEQQVQTNRERKRDVGEGRGGARAGKGDGVDVFPRSFDAPRTALEVQGPMALGASLGSPWSVGKVDVSGRDDGS